MSNPSIRRLNRDAFSAAGAARRKFAHAVVVSLLALAAVAGPATQALADGITWEIRDSAADNNWFSVAYGVVAATDQDLWVAVADTGTGNRVMTSTDGSDWRIGAPAADNSWRSVAYGNGLWVAVAASGTGNRVMTSEDPACTPVAPATSCWTARNSAVDRDWFSVTYGVVAATGKGLWVAVAVSGSGERVMTSPDGITWSMRTSATDNNWTSVAYGDGLWVAVANRSGTGDLVMTSEDPACTPVAPATSCWTTRKSAADIEWFSVAYGDGLWVAVASTGSQDRVMTSPDGSEWTLRPATAANPWRSVAYGDGLWVAVARGGSGGQVMTSGAALVRVRALATSPRVAPVPPGVSCGSQPLQIETAATCTITGGDPGIDILWRAAYNPVFAGEGLKLDADGIGTFSFTVPAAALGQVVTVELVEWLAPVSLGVAGGPVPTSVPSGGGPMTVWPLVMFALAGGLLEDRRTGLLGGTWARGHVERQARPRPD